MIPFRTPISPTELVGAPDKDHVHALNQSLKALAERVRASQRRLPIVLEFVGSPKAGKSTVRQMVHRLCEKLNLRVFAPPEGASVYDGRGLRENLVAYNAWTGTYALQHVLQSCLPHGRFDLLLLDRGMVDACCWFEVLKRKAWASEQTAVSIQRFFGLPDWLYLVDGCIVMTCSVDTSLRREENFHLSRYGNLGTGRELLDALLSVYSEPGLIERFVTARTPLLRVDTTGDNIDTRAVAMAIAERIIGLLTDAVTPMYLTVPRTSVAFSGFKEAGTVDESALLGSSQFVRSDKAESDDSRKQLVAYAVVQVDHKFLRLHRTGHANRPELRSKLSVGVGGHVEQEDATGTADLQATLKNCLLRELKEELLFDGTPELKLLGFVNDESVDAGRFHMAAVYLAKFAPGRVRVRPEVSDQEFGTKSWAMVEPEKITREISSFDPWSQHIIAHLWKVPLPTRASQGFISYSGESSQPK